MNDGARAIATTIVAAVWSWKNRTGAPNLMGVAYRKGMFIQADSAIDVRQDSPTDKKSILSICEWTPFPKTLQGRRLSYFQAGNKDTLVGFQSQNLPTSDKHVSIPHFTVVVGEHDVTTAIPAKFFMFAELTVGNRIVPTGCSGIIINCQLTIDPVANPVTLNKNFSDVEFALGILASHLSPRIEYVVQRRREVVAIQPGECSVIQNLIFTAQQAVPIILHAVFDAAVALLRDTELEPQFEVTVFFPSNDVTSAAQ